MKLARNSIALDYIWHELCMPEFPIEILKDEWFIEMATGILPDLSGRNHRKVFYSPVNDTPGPVRCHNLTDFFGKPRTWGHLKVLTIADVWALNPIPSKATQCDVFLVYDKHGIVDRLRAITPYLILGKFYRPADNFMGYFWLKNNLPVNFPKAPSYWGDIKSMILLDDDGNIIESCSDKPICQHNYVPYNSHDICQHGLSDRLLEVVKCTICGQLSTPPEGIVKRTRPWPEPPPTKRPKEADSPDIWFPFN